MGACLSSQPDQRRTALVIWDIENMKPPLPGPGSEHHLKAGDIMCHVRKKLVTGAGYIEYKTLCCMTPISMRLLGGSNHLGFIDSLVGAGTVMLASTFSPKRGSDSVLLKEIQTFIAENASKARADPRNAPRIVLITSDGDYATVAACALEQGFDVQLLYHEGRTARTLLQLPYKTPPLEWVTFLTECNGGKAPNLVPIPMTVETKTAESPQFRFAEVSMPFQPGVWAQMHTVIVQPECVQKYI